MIKVTITDSSGREREIEVGPEPQVLGRGEDSNIVLGSRSVSRHHLRIWEEDGRVMVEDLTGGTGITLDGEPATDTFELEPGADMEAGVFVFTIPGSHLDTSHDGAAFGEEVPIPLLVVTKGPSKGSEVELQDGDNDVGRDATMYLQIDDASISRQHARITVGAGQFTLIDMRSSNGTFVNNKRVEEAQLRSGDLVRFGNQEFQFLYGAATSKAGARAKRKKLILFGGVGLVVLILIIGVVVKMTAKPVVTNAGKTDDPTISFDNRAAKAEQYKNAAKGFMEDGEWKEAIVQLDKALELRSIDMEAKKLKSTCEDEMANKTVYDECTVAYELNRWTDALACYGKLPKGTYYHRKSKYKMSECKKRLKSYHLGEGKGYYNANRLKEAHEHFVAYMTLDPCDQQVYRKWLKGTEKRLKSNYIKKGWTPYDWACETQREAIGSKLDPEEAIKALYPDARFNKAMWAYFNGKVESAIRELQKVVSLERDQGRVEKAREYIAYLRVVNGKYNDGLTQLLRGKVKDAREQFDQALLNDSKLMPKGVISFYREDMGKQLSTRLYKEGFAQFSRNHYSEAFKIWTECLQRNPDSKECANGMSMLESVANEALQMASDREQAGDLRRVVGILKTIKEITRPESMAYKRANLWLSKIEEQ